MIEAIIRLTDAIYSEDSLVNPRDLRAQQQHQAVTIPALRAKAIEAICDSLSEMERDVLRECLDAIDGIR